MSIADTQYLNIVENILDHGYFDNNRTGVRRINCHTRSCSSIWNRNFPS